MAEQSEEYRGFEERMNKMWEEMNRMWEDFWGVRARRRPGRLMLPWGGGERALAGREYGEPMQYREPLIDVYETDDEVIVTAEIPGLDKDDIKVYISGNRLELSAEKTSEVTKPEKKEKEGEGNYVYRERSVRRFYRSVTLPAAVDPEKSKSSYKHGIIEIRMPKSEVTKKTAIKID